MIDRKRHQIRQRTKAEQDGVAIGETVEQLAGDNRERSFRPSNPPCVPIPITVATARLGNMSETVV